jgi:hypothetical protein
MGNEEQATDATDIDPDALREAEFLQTQLMLDSLVGKTIAVAKLEGTRIAVSTTDDQTFCFYGFMGRHSEKDVD